MDLRDTWHSIANTLYPIFFTFLLSALLIWEKGIFDWIGEWEHNEISISFSILSTILILTYFLIDWIDANVVSVFDQKVERKDIIIWILKLSLLSIFLVFFIHIERPLILLIFILYHLSQFISVYKRDKFADSTRENLTWQKEDSKEYKRTLRYSSFSRLVMLIDFLAFLFATTIFFVKIDISIVILYSIVIISLLFNVILKYARHKIIFMPLYFHFLNKEVPNE